MRTRSLLLALPLVLVLSACGDNDVDQGRDGLSPAQEQSAAPTTAAPTTPPASAAPAGDALRLIGTIGSADDPEAYEIGLTQADGSAVQTLPAGTYQVQVNDQSFMHNWHLTGEGVDVRTGVAAKESKVFTVELVQGETYEFVCDPHTGSMSGQITVT